MPAVKLNISLDEPVARTLRRRAGESGKSTSRYLAELIEQDARRHQDELAAEGYRALSSDTAHFAADALPLAHETWPEWTGAEEAVTAAGHTDEHKGADGGVETETR